MPKPRSADKSYYQLLELASDASSADVKRAFRREIAKYHPEKFQHLGRELRDVAAGEAAVLTQAYRTLTDPAARVEYDTSIGNDPAAFGATSHETSSLPSGGRTGEWPRWPSKGTSAGASPKSRQNRGAGTLDAVRRVTMARFRQAVDAEFADYEEVELFGFDFVGIPKAALLALRQAPRILGRFLSQIDGPAVDDTWGMASRMKKDGKRDLCVFLMAPAVAQAADLDAVIAERRRQPMPAGGKLVLIPVNASTWNAQVPADAPPVVKSLLARLD